MAAADTLRNNHGEALREARKGAPVSHCPHHAPLKASTAPHILTAYSHTLIVLNHLAPASGLRAPFRVVTPVQSDRHI